MDSSKKDASFLGHPRGLSTLFFTEMWERFSYYGMRAILLYYMYYSVADGGLGFDRSTASAIMSIYGSLVFLLSIVGGYLSDRILGSRRTVFIGGVMIMLGHIALALPFGQAALFVSIILIVLGSGLLKPNISEMVGDLYDEKDLRRDAGFNIFVFSTNLGAFIAPLFVGYLGQEVNFHLGFSLAAIGMFFGLLQYVLGGKKYLPEETLKARDPIQTEEIKPLIRKSILAIAAIAVLVIVMQMAGILNINNVINLITIFAVVIPIYYFVMIIRSKKITSTERSRVWAYVPLFIASVLFWSIEEQGSVVLALFAEERTYLSLFGFTIPSSWFQTLNPFFIMIYTPLFVMLWTKLGNKQPTSAKKFTYGLFFAGISFLWMMLPGILFGTDVRVGPQWLLMSWALVIIGEMLISPIGLSVTTKLAPKAFHSQMMSIWFLSDAVAQAINAQIVRLYSPGTEVMYFGVVGVVTVVFGILLLLMVPRIQRLMSGVN